MRDERGVALGSSIVASRLGESQFSENASALRILALDDIDLALERYDDLAMDAMDPATAAVTSRAFLRKHGLQPEKAGEFPVCAGEGRHSGEAFRL